MNSLPRITCVALCLLGLPGFALADVVDFTPGEGYAALSNLDSHPDWVAQAQWTIEAVGDGVARDLGGAFIRGNYQGTSAPNNVVESFKVSAMFNLIGNYTVPGANFADFAEPIFVLNVTETSTSTPAGRMGAALALEDDGGANELQLRFLDAAIGSISLGDPAIYDGHTFTLEVEYTKLDATTYRVTAMLDSLGDAAGPFEITDTMVVPDVEFSNALGVFGVMQTVTASTQAYGGVQVDQFSFQAVAPDLVPSAPVVVPNAVLVIDTLQLGIEGEVDLQTMTDASPGVWVNFPATQVDNGATTVRYTDLNGLVAGSHLFRLLEDPVLFSDDFESASPHLWTETSSGVTQWERGTPALNNAFVNLNAAASGVWCWGTDLDNHYNLSTDVTLTSPVFTLPATGPLTLEWMEWRDMDNTPLPGDQGFVRLIDLDVPSTTLLHTSAGSLTTWAPISVAIPASALGHSVQIEFQFQDDADPNHTSGWGGWYIDDVKIAD